jgi:hypothetical protein
LRAAANIASMETRGPIVGIGEHVTIDAKGN